VRGHLDQSFRPKDMQVRNECGAAMMMMDVMLRHERTELGPLATNKKAKNQNVSKVLRPSSIEPG
jgi:hypothetical protein